MYANLFQTCAQSELQVGVEEFERPAQNPDLNLHWNTSVIN